MILYGYDKPIATKQYPQSVRLKTHTNSRRSNTALRERLLVSLVRNIMAVELLSLWAVLCMHGSWHCSVVTEYCRDLAATMEHGASCCCRETASCKLEK